MNDKKELKYLVRGGGEEDDLTNQPLHEFV